MFVAFITAATFLIFFLFKYNYTRCLWAYMGFSGLLIFGVLGAAIGYEVIQTLMIPLDILTYSLCVYNVSIVGVLAVFFWPSPLAMRQGYLIAIAAIVAFYFTRIPEWTTWTLLIAMAIYDLYAVLTLISFFLFLPFALVLEGNKLAAAWPPVENLQAIPEKIMGVPTLSSEPLAFGYELVLWTGFFYYMYNEMAYLVLGEVSATAQAVANTVKRVVILLATVAFLGESMDENKAAGAAVAIGATMIYSIAKSNAAKK